MKNVTRVLLLSLALLLATGGALFVVSAPAWADEIAVISDSHQNKFPTEILFKLQATAAKEIKNVTLYYKFKNTEANSYARPQFTSGSKITAEYSFDVRKNYVPPGTDVTYYWQLEDTGGGQLKTQPITFTYEDNRYKWQSISEGSISVHYYGNESRAKELLAGAVEAVTMESTALKVNYTRPMKIYVYNSRDDMRDALPRKSETYDSRTTTLGVRLSPEILLLLGSQSGVRETMFHEIMHMIVAEAAEGPYSEVPSWLNEGLAMWSEGPMTPEYQQTVNRAARDGRLISVRSLTSYTGDPGQVNLFYGESWSIVSFMIDTYGMDKMAELLAVFKQGSTMEKALNKVYGFGMDELDARWRASIGAPAAEQGSSSGRTSQPQSVPTRTPFGSPQQTSRDNTWAWLGAAAAGVLILAAGGGLMLRRRKAS